MLQGEVFIEELSCQEKNNSLWPAPTAGSFYFFLIFSTYKLFYSMVYGNTCPWMHTFQID